MAKPYSMDLRERAMARLEAGETSREVASALKVAVSSEVKWAARKRCLGSASPGKMGGHRPYLILNRSEKEWKMPPREWTMAKAQFAVIFGERFIKAMAA